MVKDGRGRPAKPMVAVTVLLAIGLVIGIALTCSMMTAGFMGTVVPMLSKRFGFDPATTAGPFETAFQDVIGFAVFLWLASLLLHWLT